MYFIFISSKPRISIFLFLISQFFNLFILWSYLILKFLIFGYYFPIGSLSFFCLKLLCINFSSISFNYLKVLFNDGSIIMIQFFPVLLSFCIIYCLHSPAIRKRYPTSSVRKQSLLSTVAELQAHGKSPCKNIKLAIFR